MRACPTKPTVSRLMAHGAGCTLPWQKWVGEGRLAPPHPGAVSVRLGDTGPQPQFRKYVHRQHKSFGIPTASVSIISSLENAHSLWLLNTVAEKGLSPRWALNKNLPRSSATCLLSTYHVHKDEQEKSPACRELAVLCKKHTHKKNHQQSANFVLLANPWNKERG